MKPNKSPSCHKEDNENIFKDRVLIARIIENITIIEERIKCIEMDQDLICKSIRRILKEKTKRAAQRN
jgi:hypothetical protein